MAISRVRNLEEAISLANHSEFANGACLYTDSAHAIRQFREGIDAGMLGINVGVPAPMAFFPFSGYKKSLVEDRAYEDSLESRKYAIRQSRNFVSAYLGR